MADEQFRWKKCDVDTANSLLSGTAFPGQVFPFDTNGLPPGIQKMPGLTEAYISGFVEKNETSPSLTGVGEFVAVRYDGTTGKGYNWGFAVSGDGSVHFTGPFKYFEGHHFNSGEAVPVEKMFNRSNLSIQIT
jgi:hypothetical protein